MYSDNGTAASIKSCVKPKLESVRTISVVWPVWKRRDQSAGMGSVSAGIGTGGLRASSAAASITQTIPRMAERHARDKTSRREDGLVAGPVSAEASPGWWPHA